MASPHIERIRQFLQGEKNAPPASIDVQRKGLDTLNERLMGEPVELLPGTQVEKVVANGVPSEWIYFADSDKERVVLYFHGGAYLLGSGDSHREAVARLSAASGLRALLPEYRLAPEHPFPAAVEDAHSAYRWLLAQGTQPEHIVISGDSAGGGLSLALLLSIRNAGDPMPAGAVLLSPWTDLAGTGETMKTRKEIDPWIGAESIPMIGQLYAGQEDVRNPLISPVYADLHGLPPLLIEVGDDEVLLDDSTRIVEHAGTSGVEVTLHVWAGMWHVFPAFAFLIDEGKQAMEEMGAFIRTRTGLTNA
ncbi:MAG TPA: alpha/beta hydrolase [Ktedonobacter sp.]|nr:alpha/beta hydrolase [Ktedonobacter sp.]